MNQKVSNVSKEEFLKQREQEFYEVFGLDYDYGSVLESLLLTSAIPIEIERDIWRNLYQNRYTQEEGENVIEYLSQNQRDDIGGGFNYQMKDINKKLKNEK